MEKLLGKPSPGEKPMEGERLKTLPWLWIIPLKAIQKFFQFSWITSITIYNLIPDFLLFFLVAGIAY
jgi:hypothetical protein